MPALPTLHPLALLRDIERRGQRHAVGLPRQVEQKVTWPGIAFKLAENLLVAPLAEVREILPFPAMSPVPGTQSWVKGIANVRGNLLPVIHLPSYLKQQAVPLGRRSRVMVVERSGIVAGLVVDEVLGMKHFLEEEHAAGLPPADQTINPYLTGAYLQQGRHWGVFSLHKLAQSPLFLQVAI